MKAYHGDHALKERVMKELAEHREADRLVKGQYWEDGKGCAVGCLVKSDDHELFSQRYGIPIELVYLNDKMFERLENHLSQQWPERFMGAINVGADLSKVHLRFMHWLLTGFIALEDTDDESANTAIDQCRASMANVALLLGRCIRDDVVSENEWSAARSVVESAAEPAAWSVAELAARLAARAAVGESAANAADYAANAAGFDGFCPECDARYPDRCTTCDVDYADAWEAMSNKLIELIKECEGEKE